MQLAQERFYLQNGTHTTALTTAPPTGLVLASSSTENGLYTLSVSAGTSGSIGTSCVATATVAGSETADKGACRVCTLDESGRRTPDASSDGRKYLRARRRCALIEIFRTASDVECRDRALVLVAAGIPAAIVREPPHWAIVVDDEYAALASDELRQYAAENHGERSPLIVPRPSLDPRAWIGSAVFAAVLFAVGYFVASGSWPLDAFERGELHGAAIRAGEWWRAVTALTLHVDSGHLAANLCFGAWFGYLAGQHLGPGIAWAAVLAAGTLTNLVEGAFGPTTHRSVGASTAVFAALGLLVACGWREGAPPGLERASRLRRSLVRWAPLVAGLALLGFLGTEGESTDLVAHFGGFCAGIALGLPLAVPRVRNALRRASQRLAGGLALAALAGAWWLALRSG